MIGDSYQGPSSSIGEPRSGRWETRPVVETQVVAPIRWRRWHCTGRQGQSHAQAVIELPEGCGVQPYCGRCGEKLTLGGYSFFSGREEQPR